MKKKNFNAALWLGKNNSRTVGGPATGSHSTTDLEQVIQRIEASHTDLTANYKDWIKIGFALANELGESGRQAFHRVSRFYPKYSYNQCDKQYSYCLRSKQSKTTIASFYYFADKAGIDIHCSNSTGQLQASRTTSHSTGETALERVTTSTEEPQFEENNDGLLFETSTLPEELYSDLPEILRESCALFEAGTDRDVFLLGSLAVLSGCLPNLFGNYFDEFYSTHLYLFVAAPASSGKGKMKWARWFGQGIHDRMVEQSQAEKVAYDRELEHYENMSRTDKRNTVKPPVPVRKLLYIPANISASAFLQALAENNFKGIIFETEADSMTNSFKQDWGGYGDMLRKAFHHETISLMRRLNNEYLEVKDPHIAMALSGTPGQVFSMMPTVEDGLFSRFVFYTFHDNSDFKHPFVSYCPVNYTEFFIEKAKEVCELYELLGSQEQAIEFKLTEAQGDDFTAQFNLLLQRGKLLIGRDFDANIKRLGLIAFRLAMTLSGLRILETGEISNPMICNDQDFRTAMTLATNLEKHAISVFRLMPKTNLNGKKLAFYDRLPPQFDRQGYLKVAAELGIIEKTADKYISQFKPKLLHHEHNLYTKIIPVLADNSINQNE